MSPSSFFTLQNDSEGDQIPTSSRTEDVVMEGAPIPAGRLHELVARGRTLKNTFHPFLSQGHAWITEKQVNARGKSSLIVLHYHIITGSIF